MICKVIIIDDKPLIREALIQTIRWEKLGCRVAAEASNGLEAKEMILRERPEIIISDIRMPGMNGLELTEFVKERLPEAKVIIITGYQEFEYAKKALQLGVFDFLLKPLENKTVEEVLAKAVTQIHKSRKEMEFQSRIILENDKYKIEADRSRRIVQSRMLYEALTHRREWIEAEEEIRKIHLDKRRYAAVVARVRTSDAEMAAEISRRITLSMREYDKRYGTDTYDMFVNQDAVFLIFSGMEVSSRLYNVRLKSHLYAVNEKLKAEYKVGCCFAVSQVSVRIGQIAESYEQALAVLNSCYFTSQEEVLFSNNYNLVQEREEGYIIQDLDKFYQNIENMPAGDLEKEIKDIIDKIAGSAKGNEFQIKCLLSEIGITIMRHYYKILYTGNEYENSINRMIQEIDGLVDVKAAGDFLYRYIESIRIKLKENTKNKNPLADSAIAYLMEHYAQDISLTSLADYLSANPSYLSRLLKQETGKNFTDILTNIRISKAKQLLNEPGSRITEVCEKVGYSDYAYFYQVFKRVENISPSEYKRRGKKI